MKLFILLIFAALWSNIYGHFNMGFTIQRPKYNQMSTMFPVMTYTTNTFTNKAPTQPQVIIIDSNTLANSGMNLQQFISSVSSGGTRSNSNGGFGSSGRSSGGFGTSGMSGSGLGSSGRSSGGFGTSGMSGSGLGSSGRSSSGFGTSGMSGSGLGSSGMSGGNLGSSGDSHGGLGTTLSSGGSNIEGTEVSAGTTKNGFSATGSYGLSGNQPIKRKRRFVEYYS